MKFMPVRKKKITTMAGLKTSITAISNHSFMSLILLSSFYLYLLRSILPLGLVDYTRNNCISVCIHQSDIVLKQPRLRQTRSVTTVALNLHSVARHTHILCLGPTKYQKPIRYTLRYKKLAQTNAFYF